MAIDAEIAHRVGCAAVTGYAPTWGPDYAPYEFVTIMPASASRRAQVIEAMRAIEEKTGAHHSSAQLYALADRHGECH